MRNNPTPAETELWKHIRSRKLLGRRFLRQHPVMYEQIGHEYFYFIPDFYCYEEKLIIELDGRIHDYRVPQDVRRQEILESRGYRIIRFRNDELNNLNQVLDKITTCFST